MNKLYTTTYCEYYGKRIAYVFVRVLSSLFLIHLHLSAAMLQRDGMVL